MSQNIDFSKLTPIEFMFGEDFEQTQELVALFEEAELYLSSFRWCEGIKRAYFGLGVSAFVGIFLFEIEPSDESVDTFHWVIAGDIPPACIATINCPNSAFALSRYIGEMGNWCQSVLGTDAVVRMHPVNMTATVESARELMRRITLLDTVILDQYRDELI